MLDDFLCQFCYVAVSKVSKWYYLMCAAFAISKLLCLNFISYELLL